MAGSFLLVNGHAGVVPVVDGWFLAAPVGLSSDDEFVGGAGEPVDGGLILHQCLTADSRLGRRAFTGEGHGTPVVRVRPKNLAETGCGASRGPRASAAAGRCWPTVGAGRRRLLDRLPVWLRLDRPARVRRCRLARPPTG